VEAAASLRATALRRQINATATRPRRAADNSDAGGGNDRTRRRRDNTTGFNPAPDRPHQRTDGRTDEAVDSVGPNQTARETARTHIKRRLGAERHVSREAWNAFTTDGHAAPETRPCKTEVSHFHPGLSNVLHAHARQVHTIQFNFDYLATWSVYAVETLRIIIVSVIMYSVKFLFV